MFTVIAGSMEVISIIVVVIMVSAKLDVLQFYFNTAVTKVFLHLLEVENIAVQIGIAQQKIAFIKYYYI